MEDKDKPNIFNGKQISFTVPDNNDPSLDYIIADKLSVREAADLDPSIHDTINKFAEVQPCSIFDIMFGGLNQNSTRPFIIKNFPEPVRKPYKLKYPNKKRKRRILKKWCNRYGWKHGRYIVIPRARFNGIVLKDGVPTFSYTAEKISE